MSKTLIRVALAAVVVNRDGVRATVPPKVPFHYEEHEVHSLEKFDANMVREADDTEFRGAMKFEDLKDRKRTTKGSAVAKNVTPPERSTDVSNSTHTREELEPMTIPELKAIAASLEGVKVPSKAEKADIIKAILVAEGVEEDDAL